MLFRAICSLHLMDEPEVLVFFEAESEAMQWPTLETLLSTAWGVPRDHIDAYNIVSEAEQLREWATGDWSTGDARLLESGCGPDGITYHHRDRTLMFVRPTTLRRLQLAQDKADALRFGAAPAPLRRAA